MTLEQLRIFIAVAECEHVTHASYALGMVQSGVSKAIAALEGEIAIRLFDRVGRNIRLTPLGAAFRDQAKDLLAQAAQLRAWTVEVGTRVEVKTSKRPASAATPPCSRPATAADRSPDAIFRVGSDA